MQQMVRIMQDAGVGMVVGLPGGGKSLCLAEMISYLPGWVFGNIDLTDDHPAIQAGNYVRIGSSQGFPIWDWKEGKGGIDRIPAGSDDVPVWIIIDEAHIRFHQFMFGKAPFELQRRFVEYISTHRKRHHRLIFASQKISKIWKEIRNVCQFYVVCFDEGKMPGFVRSCMPKGLLPFKRVMYADESLKPGDVMAMEVRTHYQARYVFPTYNTRQIDHD